jgi:hypothetical protein
MYAMSWKIPARNPAAEILLPKRTHADINPISTDVVYLPYADFVACAGSDCDYVDAGSGSESGLDGFRPLPPPHPLVVGFIVIKSLPQGADPLTLPLREVRQVEII